MNQKDIKQLVDAMKEVFPTAEMMNKSFQQTQDLITKNSTAIKAVQEDVQGMHQEMNARFDKIDRDMQTVIHLQRLDEEMAGVYERLKTLEQEAGISAQ